MAKNIKKSKKRKSKPSQLDLDLYNVYCACSNAEPVPFQEWKANQDQHMSDFRKRLNDGDVPGHRD